MSEWLCPAHGFTNPGPCCDKAGISKPFIRFYEGEPMRHEGDGLFSVVPDWAAWKRHLMVCADCTAGDICIGGRFILGSASDEDAPWLVAHRASRIHPQGPV